MKRLGRAHQEMGVLAGARSSLRVSNAQSSLPFPIQMFHIWLPSACRFAARFPEDFLFQLNAKEKSEVITNCDHLNQLKFAKSRPFAFTEHGAIMAATVLNSKQAVSMSVFVVRAFVQMREQLAANREILKRRAKIDNTLLQHDAGLRDIYKKLLPLLQPGPVPPKRRIGFGGDDKR